MVNAVGELLPLMVAVALSTVPILVTVTILLTPHSHRTAIAFLVGWLVGMFVVTGLLALILQQVPRSAAPQAQPRVGIAEIVIGCALLAYGVFLVARRHSTSPRTEVPRWLRSVGELRPIASLALAVALNLRPKALLLSATAGIILGTSRLTGAETIAVLAIFVAVGGSTVTVPVVLTVLRPDTMRRTLQTTETWITRNSRTVTLVVVFIAGAIVLGDGMTRL
jgi:hypothetical protein